MPPVFISSPARKKNGIARNANESMPCTSDDASTFIGTGAARQQDEDERRQPHREEDRHADACERQERGHQQAEHQERLHAQAARCFFGVLRPAGRANATAISAAPTGSDQYSAGCVDRDRGERNALHRVDHVQARPAVDGEEDEAQQQRQRRRAAQRVRGRIDRPRKSADRCELRRTPT